MKNESGKASHGAVFKVAAFFIICFGLIVFWHGRSRRDDRPAESLDAGTAPAESSETANTPDEPSEADSRPAQRGSRAARPAPVRVQPFRGQYCASVGPPGWAVTAENAQRESFGADLASADG